MSVYIGAAKIADYTAMQGPCPTGFHVPSKDEWKDLCGVLTSTFGLASNSTTTGTYLKMPMAGHRNFATSNVDYDGTGGYYWSSTAYSTSEAYYLYFRSSSLSSQSQYYRAFGFSMRCFKDTPVTPDSNWTTLYQGTGSAGVFRNSSLGLISVSGNGTTWYTIQDKNLGATAVYNQGDTLSDANCGYFYQWGNNYGFAHSGTITTSSTQVDANNYGPGNYYSSDTFITRGSRPYDWSSVQNDNLWGGDTGVQQTLKELKSAYIGEYIAPREPNANTVAYWPLNSTTTVNDQSGNGYNLTQHSGGFTTIDGVSCFYTNAGSGSGYLDLTSAPLIPTGDAARTILFWIRSTGYSSSRSTYCFNYGGSDQETGFNVFISSTTRRSLSTNSTTITGGNTQFNTWQLIIATSSGNTFYLYVDGTRKKTATTTQYNINTSAVSSGLPLVLMRRWGSYTNTQSDGYLSEVIIENRQRSDAEITAYYNHTKGNYGIS